MNRQEKLARQRERRKLNNNAYTKKYEKTKKGFLMRLYRNMKSRISGVQKEKFYLYKGLGLLDKKTFYEWALADPKFHELFEIWELTGYQRKLTPSVDRIDSTRGYDIGNMRWLTHSENSKFGARHSMALFHQYMNTPPWKKSHGFS